MAFGTGTIGSLGGAVQDIFGSEAHKLKAQGLRLEAQNYDEASVFARQNAEFAKISTGMKLAQQDREIYKTLGGIEADVAGAGFAASGSGLDILRDSASQGALLKAAASTQGLIQEEGYQVQSRSYTRMGEAARLAASAEDNAAEASLWSAGFKGANAIASIFLK